VETKTAGKRIIFIYLEQLQGVWKVTARHIFSYQSIQNPLETNGINLEMEEARF
jgi:hypothetical protein